MDKARPNFFVTLLPLFVLAGAFLAFNFSSGQKSMSQDYNVLGKSSAKITIVEYSDFQCPYCGAFFRETLPELKKKYVEKGVVKFVYKDFPLSFHQEAHPAALASHCAGEQGKFWEYHDLLFTNQQALGEKLYKELARKLSLNFSQFEKCLESKKYAEKVEASFQEGQKKGVKGTPALFINSIKVEGALPLVVFDEIIRLIQEGKEKEVTVDEAFINGILRKKEQELIEKAKKEDPEVEMLVLTDKECQECNPGPVVDFTRTRIFPNLKVRSVELKSEEGKKLLALFEVNSIPAYFFTSSVEEATFFERVKSSLIKKDGLYQIHPSQVESQRTLHPPQPGNSPYKGKGTAPVTIIEFSDFQCPYCARFFHETLRQVEQDYVLTGKVKFVYKQYPLTSIHPLAFKAAEASLCAFDQGKFWEYHDELFSKQGKFTEEDLIEIARRVGLKIETFQNCVQSQLKKEQVEKEMEEGDRAGVNATPTFFINGVKVSGAMPYEQFRAYIERALAKAE